MSSGNSWTAPTRQLRAERPPRRLSSGIPVPVSRRPEPTAPDRWKQSRARRSSCEGVSYLPRPAPVPPARKIWPPPPPHPPPQSLQRLRRTMASAPLSERRGREASYPAGQGGLDKPRLRPQQSMPSVRSGGGSSRTHGAAISHATADRALRGGRQQEQSQPSKPALSVSTSSANSAFSSRLQDLSAPRWIRGGTSAPSTPHEKKDSVDSTSGDSGFEETPELAEGNKVPEAVKDGWNKLRRAVWGEEATASEPEKVQPKQVDVITSSPVEVTGSSGGARLWDTLLKATTTMSHSVSERMKSSDELDNDKVGADGETLLGRTIREFHFQRASSVEDVPEWVLNDSEKASRSRPRPSLAHSRSQNRRDDEEDGPSYSTLRERQTEREYAPTVQRTYTSAGSSRATERLKALRDAKRHGGGATRSNSG